MERESQCVCSFRILKRKYIQSIQEPVSESRFTENLEMREILGYQFQKDR